MTMGEQPTILVIEDDQFLTKAYQAKLSRVGMVVETAADGDAGMAKIQALKPDLILLDLMLPKKNGFEVLEQVQANAELKNIPVIVLSNLGQDTDIEKGKQLGAVDYLVKTNVKLDAVVEKIRAHLPSIGNGTVPSATPQA